MHEGYGTVLYRSRTSSGTLFEVRQQFVQAALPGARHNGNDAGRIARAFFNQACATFIKDGASFDHAAPIDKTAFQDDGLLA